MILVTLDTRPILVSGATGYIGGRLVPRLLEAGYHVRCVARSPRKLESRGWIRHPNVEVVEADLNDIDAIMRAAVGCRAAYYLVHSMQAAGSKYREVDRRLASNFVEACVSGGVERMLYLGGLGETGDDLSEHLSSRREVEQILGASSVPLTVFRAAMIIGSGSASFEILRYLVERLPLMITPRWVVTRCQPIAVRNVLAYLIGALDAPETAGRTLDIGGPDVVTYLDLMNTMAKARGLPRRRVLAIPLLTPRLSSAWIHLVTPVSARMARPLAEGLRNEVVCRNDDAAGLIPQALLTVQEAIDAALLRTDEQDVETSWSAAGPIPGDPGWAGGEVFRDTWTVLVASSEAAAFKAICRVGGGHGYYALDWLWRVRGWMDRLVGGPGLRRGRRDPENVAFGEALDFWRVTGIEAPEHLALRAEMKVPGEALLEFHVEPADDEAADGESDRLVRVVQTASFIPRGLFGLIYWYAVLPLHGFVFRGMLRGIRKNAEKEVHPSGRPKAWRDPKVHSIRPEQRWRRLTPGTALGAALAPPRSSE
ncbi:3 beta-hydroxysteroid dehydrogenase/Delta 5--_4-isomerase [Planctomycetes bacterium Poly30]|uniref:3 beta-hydroxysteroid dehydrogenase/Delta 5-->4-isomerase n=1 Tax=Saltatorellus ferox TaxID=2528018 RepID=A0A518EZ52_9BACT|nr:3 beta-hydroxysteroid dehydrogenase/Delta 5-->4-isomerase [Planctomycetes bacterium Poly30]